jgi:glycosyltransferase involved in cell wall biosynthesis/GT2 family glycosyltransferase
VEIILLTAEDYEWTSQPPVAEVHRLFRGRRTNPEVLWRIARSLIARGYRTWHLQSASHPGYLALLVPLLRLAGARDVLVTAHNAVPHNSGLRERWIARALLRQADALFAHGPTMAAEVARVAGRPLKRVVDVPLGNFEELPLPWSTRCSRDEILFFGYIHPAKGLDILIRAAGILHRRGIRFPLRIAGRAEESWAPYRELLDQEGLDDARVELDYIEADRLAALFGRAAVLVLPYRTGSQSGVPQVAARYETPVVATRVGGMEDHLIHEECALLVPPGNPERLADALARVLTDRGLATRLGRGLREHYRTRSSVDEIVRRTLPVYRREPSRGVPQTAGNVRAMVAGPGVVEATPPFVSVLVPVRNESAHIDACLDAIAAQEYPVDRMELLVADGRSTDDTRDRIRHHIGGVIPVRLIDNPSGIVPSGMNAALDQARGKIVVRVDGHTCIATDYVREAVDVLTRTGAAGVGGPMHAVGSTPLGRAVAAATSSPFGIGDSDFHYADKEVISSSVYMGVYWAQTLRDLGGYDEELARNQDDELNARIRAAGGTLVLSPRLRSCYVCRGSWRALWRQYFQYGSWKVRSLRKTPAAFRPRHAVPALFCTGLLLGPATGLLWPPVALFYLGILSLYGVLAASAAFRARRLVGSRTELFLVSLMFPTIHVAYGMGTFHGLVRFRGGFRAANPRTLLRGTA